MPLVIDTNVFCVAEGMNPGASENCVDSCTDVLLRVKAGHPLLVDSGDEVLIEYVSALRPSGTSGLAVKLADHLYRTRFGGMSCQMIAITPLDVPPGSYAEVPPTLRNFDADDQKFIAVAGAAGGAPPIVVGVDGEWWTRQADFAANGLNVQFPCMADLMAP